MWSREGQNITLCKVVIAIVLRAKGLRVKHVCEPPAEIAADESEGDAAIGQEANQEQPPTGRQRRQSAGAVGRER